MKIKQKFKDFFSKKRQPASMQNIYSLDGRVPLLRSIPFGLQHVLAMFVANIAPIFIVAAACGIGVTQTASLIQTAMIVAGVGTLIQLFSIIRVGAKLPIVMGISFTFVGVFCAIGARGGYETIIGAVIIGGVLEGFLGLFAKYWRKIISPIVAACVVTAIGFSLLSVGADSFGGGASNADFGCWQNWVLGSVTLVVCILFHIFVKGTWKQLSVLAGLVVGYVLAVCLGVVDFSALKDVKVLSLPQLMPYKPKFEIGAIISVAMIFLVSATETIGDTCALTANALGRPATDREISGSLACDGFMSSVSACFGCMPITSFSQNVGLIAMTKVINRKTIATGAVIMILAGFFPAVGAVLATLPSAVLGGCTLMMFGNIVVSGLQMVSDCGFSQRNVTIAALSLSIGLGFTQIPDLFSIFPEIVRSIFADNCVAVVFVVSIILNLALPRDKKKDKVSSEEGVTQTKKQIKILAIGNSFSEDATEYLWDIFKNGGYEDVVIGNLYIAGCSLDMHYDNMMNNTQQYRFYKNTDGIMAFTDDTPIDVALKDCDWDVITVQQCSGQSGRKESFDNLENVISWINKNKTNPNAKIVWNMTWAYQANSDHQEFVNYNSSQQQMYDAIVQTVNEKIVDNKDVCDVIPSGTAIQNLRTSILGDTLTRDGFHMSYDVGRYAVALCWFAKLSGCGVDNIDYLPNGNQSYVDNLQVALPYIKESVKNAIANPYAVTPCDCQKTG